MDAIEYKDKVLVAEPTNREAQCFFTLPSNIYLNLNGTVETKRREKYRLAEIIKALSIGVAIKLSNLISGNIKLNTTAKAASITKK